MMDRLLDTNEVAGILGLKPQSIRLMRLRGSGPKFCRIGSRIRYMESDVQSFICARRYGSTADASEKLREQASTYQTHKGAK